MQEKSNLVVCLAICPPLKALEDVEGEVTSVPVICLVQCKGGRPGARAQGEVAAGGSLPAEQVRVLQHLMQPVNDLRMPGQASQP